jgi:hypothetical protein
LLYIISLGGFVLIDCPDCDRRISSSAEICPFCGCKVQQALDRERQYASKFDYEDYTIKQKKYEEQRKIEGKKHNRKVFMFLSISLCFSILLVSFFSFWLIKIVGWFLIIAFGLFLVIHILMTYNE